MTTLCVLLPSHSQAVLFDWVTVGNPGNADDPEHGIGSVDYTYRISKYEVTNAQYTEFLNAVDPTGANHLGLYHFDMAGNFGGIEFEATNLDGEKYFTKSSREQNPVTHVLWYDAFRFANWLHNGKGTGDTETGAYTILGNREKPLGGFISRNSDARIWLPSEDEWFKAAYHDASSGTAGVYYDFATGSDEFPISDQPSNQPGAINYFRDDGLSNGFNDGYAVSGTIDYPSSTNPFTDVGAYTSSPSPYGTHDQNGNVWEWNDTHVNINPGLRGGSWISNIFGLDASIRYTNGASTADTGFRVASLADPSSLDGDFDGDGDVDGGDLLEWQRTPAVGGLENWQANYGIGTPSATTFVPEPSTSVLLMLALALVILKGEQEQYHHRVDGH